jgi:hypothetical protein
VPEWGGSPKDLGHRQRCGSGSAPGRGRVIASEVVELLLYALGGGSALGLVAVLVT